MKLEYDFGDGTFEFDANVDDFIRTLSNDDIFEKAFLIYKYYLTDEDKESLKEEGIKDEKFFSYANPDNPDTISVMKDIFEMVDEDVLNAVFEDEMKAYYEDDAQEQYEENVRYQKDPLDYFGMKSSDFI